MQERKRIDLGTFEIKNPRVMVSDPCYSIGTWCQGSVDNVHTGTWKAHIVTSDEGKWGVRPAELHAVLASLNPSRELSWTKEEFEVGVDSGQAGIFDMEHYKDDSVIGDLPCEFDHDWYGMVAHVTLKDERQAGTIPFGVVSSSGYGDGGYDCFTAKVNGRVVAIKIIFIPEEQ